MTDKILIITPPDDTYLQGIRVTHVNLSEEQSSTVSSALIMSKLPHSIINYVWKQGESVEWLLDKVAKSNLVIFNAESPDQTSDLITGWISAQPHSYYFGRLKDLHIANNNAIYSAEDILTLLEKVSNYYEQI